MSMQCRDTNRIISGRQPSTSGMLLSAAHAGCWSLACWSHLGGGCSTQSDITNTGEVHHKYKVPHNHNLPHEYKLPCIGPAWFQAVNSGLQGFCQLKFVDIGRQSNPLQLCAGACAKGCNVFLRQSTALQETQAEAQRDTDHVGRGLAMVQSPVLCHTKRDIAGQPLLC